MPEKFIMVRACGFPDDEMVAEYHAGEDVSEFEMLLACYRSGQVSERQWQGHLKDRAFREWMEDQLPINCPSACSGGDNPGQEGEGAAADQQGGGREATMADIAEKLRATTIEMASACSVDMRLWNAHSNAALAAISEIDRLRALNAEMREALELAADRLLACAITVEQWAQWSREARAAIAKAEATATQPVAHAYVVDGECEQIEWGGVADYPDDPALVWLYTHPTPDGCGREGRHQWGGPERNREVCVNCGATRVLEGGDDG